MLRRERNSHSARDEGARLEEEKGVLRLEVIQNSLYKDVPKQHLLWLVGMQVSLFSFNPVIPLSVSILKIINIIDSK